MSNLRIVTNGNLYKVQKRVLFVWYDVYWVPDKCEVYQSTYTFNSYGSALRELNTIKNARKAIKVGWWVVTGDPEEETCQVVLNKDN